MSKIKEVIIASSGLATRMGYLTNEIPKPMVKFKGKSLIEHLLDFLPLEDFETIHVNSYLHKEVIAKFMENEIIPKFTRKFPRLKFNFVRESEHLESGGSVLAVINQMKEDAFFRINVDLYAPEIRKVIHHMDKLWNSEMNGLLLLSKANDSDFSMTKDARIIRKNSGNNFLYDGVQILSKKVFANCKIKKFSLFKEFIIPEFLNRQSLHLEGFHGVENFVDFTHVGSVAEFENASS